MATNTYVALQAQTLTTTTASVTFSSISQAYTDLVLVISAKNTTGQNYETFIRFNSDSGSNYSQTFLQNYAGSTQTGRNSNITEIRPGKTNNLSFDANIININNYSNSTTYKTTTSRGNNADFNTSVLAGLWRNTAAITRIDVICESGASYTAGSTFTLYGIANPGITPKATGGTITQDATYTYHTFGASGTFTPQQALTADILVVAGGGGSGRIITGGGGAGGLLNFASQSLTATGYTVTVGSGGSGRTSNSYGAGNNGNDSQFGALTLVKGGGTTTFTSAGSTGGSGGGASGGGGILSGGSATSGQGNAGGSATIVANNGAGGGGAGAVGGSPTSTLGGSGGIGSSTYSSWGLATGTGQNISGTYYYAGGGGGSASVVGATASNAGSGGYGGGGNGGYTNAPSTDNPGTAGAVNTGGGGGGASNDYTGYNSNTYGQNGGSGIVIIRYAN
jgi:hypothetical protein